MYDMEEQGNYPVRDALWQWTAKLVDSYKMRRGLVFGMIIVAALVAFELFNYTTTDFALTDLLGDLRFVGVRWATILSIAFCAMDFAGIARLFTPEQGRGEKLEVWYLLAAWFLAATMNAMLTWWGVSIALLTHTSLGNEILGRDQLLAIVPVFVAILVWLIRILIIGTFSVAGDRLFTQTEDAVRTQAAASAYRPAVQPASVRPSAPVRQQTAPPASRPVARTAAPRQVSSGRPAQVIGDPDDDFGPGPYSRPQARSTDSHGSAPGPRSFSSDPRDPGTGDYRRGDVRRAPVGPGSPSQRSTPPPPPPSPVRPVPKPSGPTYAGGNGHTNGNGTRSMPIGRSVETAGDDDEY